MNVIATQIVCMFTLECVYATLTTILMILFSNAGQLPKDAIIRTPITHNAVPAYQNPNATVEIHTQTRRLPTLKALPLLRAKHYRIHKTQYTIQIRF